LPWLIEHASEIFILKIGPEHIEGVSQSVSISSFSCVKQRLFALLRRCGLLSFRCDLLVIRLFPYVR